MAKATNGFKAAALAICLCVASATAATAAPKTSRPALPTVPSLVDATAATTGQLAKGVTYFVIPHPDDELSAWALVQRAKFPVFVLLTQGERSARCAALHFAAGDCKADRLAAWNRLLDAGYGPGEPIAGPDFSGTVGPSSARLVFDLGDRSLTPAKVTHAIDEARTIGAPLGEEEFVVSASIRYGHPDHEAAYAAVRDYRGLGRLAVSGTPRAQRNVLLPVTDIEALTACPGGLVDTAYGWLSGHCWSVSNNLGDAYRVANPQLFINFDLTALAGS